MQMERKQDHPKKIHEMRLRKAPFRAVASGKKTIEMRLFDEKRQAVRVGDYIRFTLEAGTEAVRAESVRAENGAAEEVIVEVVALHVHPHFEALYAALIPALGKTALGYGEDESADPADMLAYYSPSLIERYGVVGIEIKQKANHDHGI